MAPRLLYLSLLCLAMSTTTAAADTSATPTITSIVPRRVSLEGGDNITVVGTNLRDAAPGAVAPLCRIAPASRGSTHVLNATAPTFPGVVLVGSGSDSGNSLVCVGAPAVVAEGPGTLVVSLDGGKTWLPGGADPAATRLTYFSLVEIAVGRRPYVTEAAGSLLLRTDASAMAGASLSVTAVLPAGGPGAKWEWHGVVGGTEVVLPMAFDGGRLPPNTRPIHNDLIVTVSVIKAAAAAAAQPQGEGEDETDGDNGGGNGSDHSSGRSSGSQSGGSDNERGSGGASGSGSGVVMPGRTYTKTRRFHRAPPPATTVGVSQVDHATSGLRVDGASWLGQGWYVEGATGGDTPRWNNSLTVLASVLRMRLVPQGINMAMVYGLMTRPDAEQLAFLDECEAMGMKIM